MTTAWTVTFFAPILRDSAEDMAQSINAIPGAALQRALAPRLARRGWAFCAPFAEDFGWFSDLAYPDDGKRIAVSLATGPDGEGLEDGSSESGRWRIVITMDLGLFAKTKARRLTAFQKLAADLHAECLAIGAGDLEWDEGGPGEPYVPASAPPGSRPNAS